MVKANNYHLYFIEIMKKIIVIIFLSFFALILCAQNKSAEIRNAWNNADYDAVIQKTTQLLKESPKSVEGYFYRAMAYMKIETYGQAIRDITSAIKYCSKRDSAFDKAKMYGIRAKIHVITGDTISALADLKSAIRESPENADLYINRASLYESISDYVNAEADYLMALQILQYDVNTEIRVAYCQFKQGKTTHAIATLDRIIRMNPRNVEAKKEMALLCKSEKRIKKFIDYYVDYLELVSDGNDELLVEASYTEYAYTVSVIDKILTKTAYRTYWLGISVKVEMANNHYDKALTSLREMESINGDSIFSPFVIYRMALCYMELSDYSKALNYYNLLIQFEEDSNSLDADDLFGRGRCYERTGNYEKSMSDYDKALELDDKNARYYYQRAELNERMNKIMAAKEDCNKAIAYDKNMAEAYLLRGKLFLSELNDTTAAIYDFKTVLSLDTAVKCTSCRQQALHFLGKNEEAKKWMNKLLASLPENAELFYNAALFYSLINEVEMAVTYLRKSFELGTFSNVRVQTEKDFENLRKCDDFNNLVKQYTEKRMNNLLKSFDKE